MKRLIVEGSPVEWRIAKLDDESRLLEIAFIERAALESLPMTGDVYLGRVRRIDSRLDAAFIDLGRGEEALLRLGDKAPLVEGQDLIVEVTAEAQDQKGPRVSRHIELSLLGCDWNALEAAAARHQAPALLFKTDPLARTLKAMEESIDLAILDSDREGAARRHLSRGAPIEIWRESAPAFEALGIESQILALFETEYAFAQGATFSIEPTAALVAIDVNSGRSPLARQEINEAAAREIARQIRLRNLAGRIVVDFIDARDSQKTRHLAAILAEELNETGRQCRVAGPTAFGLVEIERQKRGKPLVKNARHAAAAVLREAERRYSASHRRLKITAGQAVHDWLKARPALFEIHVPFDLELAPGLQLDQTRIEEI